MFDNPAQNHPSQEPGSPASSGQETDESEGPKGTLELTRGTRLESGSPSNTYRLRKHALRFFISRYEGDNHGSFECKAPGDESESWGIERPESDRQWEVPSRCATMQNGYVYVFRGPKNGKLNKGVIYAAYEVKAGRYIPLEVTQDKVHYDKPQTNKKVETFAVLEKISAGVHIPPSGSLRIVDSKIQLSQKRIFGPGGLKDDPSKHGIPYPFELEGTCDLPPAGLDPTKAEIEDYFAWTSVDALVRTDGAWDKPWQRQRRHHQRGELDIVEFFSVDPFAEARRRNANYANALKKRMDYVQGEERANLAFLSHVYKHQIKQGKEKYINQDRIRTWSKEDQEKLKQLEEAVSKAAQACVDWIHAGLFREWLLDYAHAIDDQIQFLALDAYLEAIADFNASTQGKTYLKQEFEDEMSFFYQGVGFSEDAKSREDAEATDFPQIVMKTRKATISWMKPLQLYGQYLVAMEDAAEKAAERASLTMSWTGAEAVSESLTAGKDKLRDVFGPSVSDRISGVKDKIRDAVSKKAMSSADLDQSFLANRFGLADDLIPTESALSKAIRLGHRGAKKIASFIERTTGISYVYLEFHIHLENLAKHGRVSASRVTEFARSYMDNFPGLKDLFTGTKATSTIDTKQLPGSSLMDSLTADQTIPRKKPTPENGELFTRIHKGKAAWFNNLELTLTGINTLFSFYDAYSTHAKGKNFTRSQALQYAAAAAGTASGSLKYLATKKDAIHIAETLGMKPAQDAVEELALKKISQSGGTMSLGDARTSALLELSGKEVKIVSGFFGVIVSCVDLLSGTLNAIDQYEEGDMDATWSWVGVAFGGAAGVTGFLCTLFGASACVVLGFSVAAFVLPLVGTISLIWTDDEPLELWIERGYFGADPQMGQSLKEQLEAYYQLVYKPTIQGATFKNNSVSLIVQPGLFNANMTLIVELKETAPNIFARRGERFDPGRNLPLASGTQIVSQEELKPRGDGSYAPITITYPTPFPVARVLGVVAVLSRNDPNFRVETKFKETN